MILFFEGFETVGTELGLANQATTRPRIELRWSDTASGGIPSIDSFYLIEDPFEEGFALNMGTSSFSTQNSLYFEVPEERRDPPGGFFREWVVGFRIHIPNNTVETFDMLVLNGLFGGTNHTSVLGFTVTDSTDLSIGRGHPGAFTIATVEDVFTPGAWHYVEIKFKIAEAASGGFVEVHIDGAEVINEQMVDTNNALTTGVYEFEFGNAGVGTANPEHYVGYDDIYIMDCSEAPHQDFLGPVRVRSLPPDGDVFKQWDNSSLPSVVTNYSHVDENGADSADYVETDVNGSLDRYTVTNVTEDDQILAVKVEAEVINATGGSPSVFLQVASGASVEEQEHIITTTTAYELLTMYVQDDPAGGDWTESAINAMQAGLSFENNVS